MGRFLAALLILLATSWSTIQSLQLYILHTNDVHARFDMFNKREMTCKPDPSVVDEKKKCYGGIIRRAGFVNRFRQSHENVLLLDAGDQFQGTPWFYTYKGLASSHFLNRLKYDAMALGNHEFDNQLKGLEPFLNNVTVPILCANLVKDKYATGKINSSVRSHVVVARGGVKIGIIGYITHAVPTLSKTENLSFIDEKVTIGKIAGDLKRQGVNIIIAVGHSGINKDKEMAAELTDVDVIVGGHSHSLFYNGVNPAGDEVIAEYPIVYRHSDNRVTLIVQAGSFGKYVGMLNLTFDSSGKLTGWSGNPVPMNDNVKDDEDIKKDVEYFQANVTRMYSVVVGSTKVQLEGADNICKKKECTIGNLFTDAMVSYLQDNDKWKHLTVGLTPGGSFRTSLEPGNITYSDILSVLPYDGNLIIAPIDGTTLKEALEHSISGFNPKEEKGKFLQMSGLKVKYNLEKADGSKVEDVQVRDCYKCNGYKPLNSAQSYDVILPEFIFNGGDGYSMLPKLKDKATHIDIQETVPILKYLEKYSPVSVEIEGRISGL